VTLPGGRKVTQPVAAVVTSSFWRNAWVGKGQTGPFFDSAVQFYERMDAHFNLEVVIDKPSGVAVVTLSLPQGEVDDTTGEVPPTQVHALALAPESGAVWLATSVDILHFSALGEELAGFGALYQPLERGDLALEDRFLGDDGAARGAGGERRGAGQRQEGASGCGHGGGPQCSSATGGAAVSARLL